MPLPRETTRHPYLALAICCLVSGLVFALTKGSILSLAPLLLYTLSLILRRVLQRARPDQDILFGLIVLSFLLDDLSQVAWGNQNTPLTERLGELLFASYGITGLEAFALTFAAWITLSTRRQQWSDIWQKGLLALMLTGSGVFIFSLLAGIYGVSTGGDLTTMFIQLRFIYVIPLWIYIGFMAMHEKAFMIKVLKGITVAITLKSIQGLYEYAINFPLYKIEEEFLVDHYFSGYCVVALVTLVYIFWTAQRAWMRALCVAAAAVIIPAFIFNDRRTSYVGVAMAIGLFPALLPIHIIKRYLARGVALALAGGLFLALTWNLPPPLGFAGDMYRSFTKEEGSVGPTYREIEDANILNALASQPLTGIGYGKEFDEIYPLPDISTVYARYRMIPHNLFLAAWAYGGPLTFGALSLLLAAMIGTAGAILRRAREPGLYLIGAATLFYVLQFIVYTYGDLGSQIARNQMLVGLLFGGAYRLAAHLKESERSAPCL